MLEPAYATLPDIEAWARGLMDSRWPDFVIGDRYLCRWHVIPKNPFRNQMIHEFHRGDLDRAMHDHPWDNASYVIAGSYMEHTPKGTFLRQPGDYIERAAEALHRIELLNGPVITLFSTGPKRREWGFTTPEGWVHWRDYRSEVAA